MEPKKGVRMSRIVTRVRCDTAINHTLQGYTIKEDCNKTEVVTHVTNLVNADTGTTGAR